MSGVISIPLTGQLKTWLDEKNYSFPDTVEVSAARHAELMAQCAKSHPDYDDDERHAWAAYSILTANAASKEDDEALKESPEARNSLIQTALTMHQVSRDMRALVVGLESRLNGLSTALVADADIQRGHQRNLVSAFWGKLLPHIILMESHQRGNRTRGILTGIWRVVVLILLAYYVSHGGR